LPTLSPPGRGQGEGAERLRARTKKLGYLERRELDGMEAAILAAETAMDARRRAAEDPSIASDPAALKERYAALDSARAEVDRLYARWEELEAKGETE
jgi:ATP-binding cassette subfamily F protein uup